MIDYEAAEKAIGLETVAKEAGIGRAKVLHGHTSMDTAYLQQDYPYGRSLRCQRRVWIEECLAGAYKGQFRLRTQTTNPKNDGRWNKPHSSTYTPWAVLVRWLHKPEGHIDWATITAWGPSAAVDVLTHVSGIYEQLDPREVVLYKAMLILSHGGDSTGWARWEGEVVPSVVAYRDAHGTWPPEGDQTATGVYLSDHERPAAIAAVLLRDYQTKV